MSVDNIQQKQSVLFVTQSPDASHFFNLLFENNDFLKQRYFIDGTLPTRESAVREVKRKQIDLVIFVDRTPGTMTISETMYNLRMRGCRVIYISTKRQVGDLVLEAIVGYGIYDIIMGTTISKEKLVSIIKHPQEFKDVAVFHRIVDVSDNSGINGKVKYKIPGLEDFLVAGGEVTSKYLTDPAEQAIEGAKTYVNEANDTVNAQDMLYREKAEPKDNDLPKTKSKSKPIKRGPEDIKDIFD